MPVAMSGIWEIIKNPIKSKQLADLLLDFDKVRGIKIDEPVKQKQEGLPEDILDLIEKRKQARQEKNWALSDELRDLIKEKGYAVKDSKDGMTVERI